MHRLIVSGTLQIAISLNKFHIIGMHIFQDTYLILQKLTFGNGMLSHIPQDHNKMNYNEDKLKSKEKYRDGDFYY